MEDNIQLNHFPRVLQLLLALSSLLAVLNFAYAQDTATNGPESPGTANGNKPLTAEPVTIIVTATKEPEPAQSIPLSVSTVTETMFRDAAVQSVKQASAYAPNVFINEFTARALSNPFFRGIGGSPTNPGISTVIDGVPQLNGFSSNIELVDIGQIEFVRGPEGALYGRNTAGGLINITSRSSSETWTSKAQGGFGNYNYRDLRASISSPLLKDRFSLNLAGGYSGRDGYTVNDQTGKDLDKRGAGFGKGQLFFTVNERLKIRWIISGERNRDGDYALGDLSSIRINPNHVSRDFEGYNRRSIGTTTLAANYQGSAVEFSSISGGVWWKNISLTDLDYQTASLFNGGLFAIRDTVDQQHQFTQEFRIASNRDKPIILSNALNVNWQAGVFAFQQNYQQEAVNDISSIFNFFPRILSTSAANLDDWGVGIYGQARFTIWEKLDVTTGLRFDYEDKNADLKDAMGLSTSLGGSFSEVSPQFSVTYRFAPNQMAYASVSRGYKAGGFNPAPTGVPAPAGTESYGPEHTWNYELGHKAAWLRDRLESTVSVFYIDWEELQLNQQIPFSGGQYYIGNAGAAYSKGIEVETRYRPFSWWEVFGMVGYTRARFLGGSSAFNANMGVNEAVGGNSLPFAPKYNANAGTQISWSPYHGATFYLRAQVSINGAFQYDASNAAGQEDYSLTNFRGGIRGRHWFAEGWTDNAFNAHYVPIAIPYAQLGAPSGYIGESGAPVTYGFRAGLNF